ncbi:MAG: adenine phosphoribosyltransferase [Defluviitaleaceae bacterium]|nr:adenine phosphoribosyltransferase [Defluviitaleaceae bacterium]
MDLKAIIRDVPDFPKAGIMFRDITTLLACPDAFAHALFLIEERLDGLDFNLVAGPESRGFIFGVPVAHKMGRGFIPARKRGKLPAATISKSYALEYGFETIEIHADAVKPGDRVVIIDDLLATGGTCKALCELIEQSGGHVERIIFLIELAELNGREVLKGYNIDTILTY